MGSALSSGASSTPVNLTFPLTEDGPQGVSEVNT